MPTLVKDKSGSYFIVYSVGGKRKWKSLCTKNILEALNRFKGCPSKYPESKRILPKAGNAMEQRLTEAQNDFLAYAKANLSVNTVKHYKYAFRAFNAIVGNPLIKSIDIRLIELYKSRRSEQVKKVSVNIQFRSIKAFFNKLVDWEVISENPCRRVKPFRLPDMMPAYLSIDDFWRLLQAAESSAIHDIILFAGMTGLRRGEIVNLKWEDIDLHKRQFIVRNTDSFSTKTGKMRTVPINSTVYTLLESLPRNSSYVFPGDRGGRYNPNFLTNRFRKVIKASKLDPRLHFHSLRHTFATFLVTKGVSLYHVQKLLGHSNPRITQVYSHLSSNDLLPSIEQISL